MKTPLEKFQGLLRELFQLEHGDLDFGVYRIMNLRRAQIEKWLNEELPTRARAILMHGGTTADDELGARLDAVKTQLLEIDPGGIDDDGKIVNEALRSIAKGKEYLKLMAQTDRAPARTAAGMEPLVFNHLYDFFSRYYDSGDFIPKRRRSFAPDGRDTYAIPWDGEEVVLHWANKDQYYIKTGERFTHYRWQSEAGARTFTVEFRITDADLPANNNKDAKKKFNLLVADKVEWKEDKATLILPFHYRGLTPEEEGQYTGIQEAKLRDSIIKRTVDTLRELPVVAGVPQLATALMAPKRDAAGQEKRDKDGNAVPLLPHHLNRWAVKNESDFFIHKDLRRFLSGELDYFLKSVVLNLDNLLAAGEQRTEPNFRLLGAVKLLGTEIVDFASQLEDFQKALFEKKKFVIEANYCITLDRVPKALYNTLAMNARVRAEWERLHDIQNMPGYSANEALPSSLLEAAPYLVVDTALLSEGEKDDLISQIDDLDPKCNGLLVHSENLQALTLLAEKYKGQVRSVYIDPPYNTGSDEFLYRDGYQESSWLSLMEDRLSKGTVFMQDGGTFSMSIDLKELDKAIALTDVVMGVRNRRANITIKRGSLTGAKVINPGPVNLSENVLVYSAPNGGWRPERALRQKGYDDRYNQVILNPDDGPDNWRFDTVLEQFAVSEGLPKSKLKKVLKDEYDTRLYKWVIANADRVVQLASLDENSVGNDAVEAKRLSTKNSDKVIHVPRADHNDYFILNGKLILFYKDRLAEIDGLLVPAEPISDIWDDVLPNDLHNEGGVTLRKGKKPEKLIQRILKGSSVESDIVMDYYMGSGTTTAVAHKMKRRYVGIEQGDYFDSKPLDRMKRVLYGEQSGVSKAERWTGGGFFKYIRLESYEDALDNIEFNSGAAPGSELGLDFNRDYELRYALDWESKDCPTRLALAQLDTPFDYTLTLRRESGTVDVKPDLPETFAYLIGLHTRRRFRTEQDGVSYLIYTGTLHADGTEVAVLWRTCKYWTEANLKAEMDWWSVQRETLAPGATRVYVNGASAIEGHYSLDAEFKTRMNGGTV